MWIDVDPDLGGGLPFLVLDGLRVERGPRDDAFVLEIERLRIPAGSFTALLGGSGIGKTTLLTVLGLLRGPHEEPNLRMRCRRFALRRTEDDSEVVVYEDLTETGSTVRLSAAARERMRREWIGFCLQGGELVPALSLSDNCAVPAHLCALPDAEQRAETYLRSLGMVDSAMGNQLDKLPGELSGGQRQRGVVARSLAHSPRMILLDEPTAALDRGTAEEAIELLRALAREHGQTVIMVTHDRALAEKYADFVIELDLVEKKHSCIQRCRARRTVAATDSHPRSMRPAALTTPRAGIVSATSFSYQVKLGLLDALGPLYYALRRRRRTGQMVPRAGSSLRFALQLVQNSAVVVAIAMMVLFLRGMRSGLIDDFRTALRKSPTARKITLFGTFGPADIARIEGAHPRIETVVPVATPKVALTRGDATEMPHDDSPLAQVTLNGLVEDDPTNILLGAKADFSDLEPDHIMLAERTATELGVAEGDQVKMWAERFLDEFGEQTEPQSTMLRVYRVLGGEDRSIGAAWVHFRLTREISQFQAGLPVKTERIDWPGVTKRMKPRYSAFLLFVRAGTRGEDSLRESDRALLRRKSLDVAVLSDGERHSLLGPLLKTDQQMAEANKAESDEGRAEYAPLTVFRCTSPRGDPLRSEQLDVQQELRGGGLLVPWNDPLDVSVPDGRTIRLLGCSFERAGNWLRPYMSDERGVFKWSDTAWSILAADGTSQDGPRVLRLGPSAAPVELVFDAVAAELPTGGKPWGIVSSQLLGQLHALAVGEAEADPVRRMIYRNTASEEYGVVNVFPDDVFSVPEIVSALIDGGFQATANTNQLREIQGYTRVLGYIVRITSILAGIIALLTIAIVFHEVGRSKKRVLATLRIMGLTRRGAFTLLMVRGVLVAFIAGGLMLIVGSLGSGLLNLISGRNLCLLGMGDYLLVLVGIFAVCIAGTYPPARSVSRTEPVVALQEAEQQG